MNVAYSILNIFALVILVILMVIFFGKERLHSIEEYTYGWLIIVSFLTIIIGIILGFLLTANITNKNKIIIVFNKLYLVGLITILSMFAFYTYNITKFYKKEMRSRNMIVYLTFIISNIMVIAFLPLDIFITDNGVMTKGLAMDYTSLLFVIIYIILIFFCLIDLKCLKNKKYIPIILLIFEGIAISIVQLYIPSANFIINPSVVITCLIMYFTIENPDLKMLEEYIKNREVVEDGIISRANILFNISEDIKNPINKIKLYSNQILTTRNAKDKDRLANDISQLSNDINSSIETIYNISNFDKRKIKIVNDSYNIYNLFNQIIYISKSKNNILCLKYSISDAILDRLYGDSSRLKQVICSLISNKNVNKPDGLVDLDIYAITKNDICRLIFTIQTNLCNYDLNYINNILSSEDETTYKDIDKIDNMNIDLKNVKKLVDLLGGIMLISTNEGIMTFKIVLEQLVDTNNEKLDILDKAVLKYSNKMKVLVVNDDYKELTMISKELKKNNLDVVSVMHENDCMDKLSSNDKYDILLLDDEMKDVAAINLVDEIDKLGLDKLIKIVMLSKDKESIKKHYIDDYSFGDYLLKDDYKDEIKRLKKRYKF